MSNLIQIALLALAVFASFGNAEEEKIEQLFGLPKFGLIFSRSFITPGSVGLVYDEQIYLWNKFKPTKAGLYNFCMCNMTGEKDGKNGEVKAKDCLKKCQTIRLEHHLEGEVQKYEYNLTQEYLQNYSEAGMTMPFKLVSGQEGYEAGVVKAKQAELVLCVKYSKHNPQWYDYKRKVNITVLWILYSFTDCLFRTSRQFL